jgi:hypothetical protein
MEFKVNPLLEAITEAGVTTRCEVVFLRGQVSMTGESSVAIRAGLFGPSTYEVELGDIISAKENADGSVAMMVRGTTPVVIRTTAGVMQTARANNGPRTPAEVEACVNSERDKCIQDLINLGSSPEGAQAGCTSGGAEAIRRIRCESAISIGGGGVGSVGFLGSEVVADEFG